VPPHYRPAALIQALAPNLFARLVGHGRIRP
jgi:hypothetical protein